MLWWILLCIFSSGLFLSLGYLLIHNQLTGLGFIVLTFSLPALIVSICKIMQYAS
jgi:hypothetical protein